MDRSETLRLIAEAAVASERATGCPAELTAAQCIIESGWLARSPGNNCFGIKARKTDAVEDRQLFPTSEWLTPDELEKWLAAFPGREMTFDMGKTEHGRHLYRVRDWFRAYRDLAGCFADHARLITTGAPYAVAWAGYLADRDLDDLIEGVAKKYATDPAYYGKIAKLAGRADVRAALTEARKA